MGVDTVVVRTNPRDILVEHEAQASSSKTVCTTNYWAQVAGGFAEDLKDRFQRIQQDLENIGLAAPPLSVATRPQTGSDLQAVADTDVPLGEKRYRKILRILDSFKFKRSRVQRLFHWRMLTAHLPSIYGDDFEPFASQILTQHGIDAIEPFVLMDTARRMGKSVSVSMFIVAYALTIPGKKIAIVATSGATSSAIISMIDTYLTQITGARERVCARSAKRIAISLHSLPAGKTTASQIAQELVNDINTTTITAYPGTEKSEFCAPLRVWSRSLRPRTHARSPTSRLMQPAGGSGSLPASARDMDSQTSSPTRQLEHSPRHSAVPLLNLKFNSAQHETDQGSENSSPLRDSDDEEDEGPRMHSEDEAGYTDNYYDDDPHAIEVSQRHPPRSDFSESDKAPFLRCIHGFARSALKWLFIISVTLFCIAVCAMAMVAYNRTNDMGVFVPPPPRSESGVFRLVSSNGVPLWERRPDPGPAEALAAPSARR